MPTDPFRKAPTGTCVNCGERQAAVWWTGEASTIDVIHGAPVAPWCQVCSIKAQIEYVEKQAVRLPGLRRELAALLKPGAAPERTEARRRGAEEK